MFTTVISWFTSALSAAFSWLTSFFNIDNGAFSVLFMSMFVVFLAVRFLIMPLTGSGMGSVYEHISGGSDAVKKKSTSKKSSKSRATSTGKKK